MKKLFLTILSMGLLVNASVISAANIGVPSECEGVMLQGFYWDSYKLDKYGRTLWVNLTKDTVAINASFDMIWLPPSASSSGGVGYIPAKMNNQNSDWGQKSSLVALIKALHDGGTKVIADIVINHRGNDSSWCTFYADDFTPMYGGKFQLTRSHICKGDEAFTNPESGCYGSTERGAADTGTDFGGARDLDHTSSYVQEWAKSYLQWMIGAMKYDGFRYDMTLGYAGKYLSLYNQAAKPYLSVSELWEGIDKQVSHLKATDYNTMIFDFPLKYVLGNTLGKSSPNYSLLIKPGTSLRGKGYKKYAVTFIDNHDTFERSDAQSQEFIGYNVDLTDAAVKNKILQANAYILLLPGVPCVFWPHWKSYQAEIDALIAVRKQAGIHSESEITEKADATYYQATVQGHRGSVILRLGPGRSTEVPEGYELAIEGGETAAYTVFVAMYPEGLQTVNGAAAQGQKFIKDGQLFIRINEDVYTILGEKIQ